MAHKASNYFTALAYARAHNLGIDLTPELGKAIIDKIQKGEAFWEGPPEQNDAIPVFMNIGNRRLRLIVDADKARIITLAERDFAAKGAIGQANRMGIVLNLAMANLLMDKIKARDPDVIDVADQGNGTYFEAKMNFDGKGLRVVYSQQSGCIIQIDDYAGPRVNPQHPAVTRHAAERAVQRYETELTPRLTDEIIRRIKTGEGLIDHYQVRSGAWAAVTEIDEGKPAVILYTPSTSDSVPIRIITVTPMDYHEAHGTRQVERREAAHAKIKESKRERFLERKKTQKKQKASFHRAQRDDDEDDLDYRYG